MKWIAYGSALILGIAGLSPRGLADTFGSEANQFTIDFVTIGDPGNAADTTGNPNPAGSVSYVYRIGKYEISRNMIEIANAEGGLGITMLLSDFVGGGSRADMPATGVSWNEAARFVNWLNTSQGFPAAYKFATQPGAPGNDASANINLWVAGEVGFDAANPFRDSQARYFLPSAHEWYKAAYYDPNKGAGGYWDFPTGSDEPPTPVASGTAAGTAVSDQRLSQGPADITLAGGLSPYGTMAQGGNVAEWVETEFDLVNDSATSDRSYRGAAWQIRWPILASLYRNQDAPAQELGDVGFRVASIPEPNAAVLIIVAGVLGWALRKRFK